MIFINNKYTEIYNQIIDRATNRTVPLGVQTEKHHIVPRSMGGSDYSFNLVKLTLREHYICHRLLPKMTTGSAQHKMTYAIKMMSAFKHDSKVYEQSRKDLNRMRQVESGRPDYFIKGQPRPKYFYRSK